MSSILRQVVLDTLLGRPDQTVPMLCRVLHIDHIQSVDDCCQQLASDGLLEPRVDTQSGCFRYTLSTQGSQLANETPPHKIAGMQKLYQVLEEKHARQVTVVQQLTHFIHRHPVTTVSFLHSQLQQVPVCQLQSAIYTLLSTGALTQCGPVLVHLDRALQLKLPPVEATSACDSHSGTVWSRTPAAGTSGSAASTSGTPTKWHVSSPLVSRPAPRSTSRASGH